MEKDFKGVDWGEQIVDLRHIVPIEEVRPIEIHHRSNGSIEDAPTFAIVSVNNNGRFSVAQISMKMLNEGLKDIGYKIVKDYDNRNERREEDSKAGQVSQVS